MTRTKVQLAYMQNEGARKSTLRKRKQGLIKKMHELSTLCGVEGCLVVYSPNCPEPDIWPSLTATTNAIQRYKDMPAFEKSKKMEDQEIIAKQELAKAQEQLDKLQKESRLMELNITVNQNMSNNRGWLQNLGYNYLTYLNNHVLQPHLEEMEAKVAMLNVEPCANPQE